MNFRRIILVIVLQLVNKSVRHRVDSCLVLLIYCDDNLEYRNWLVSERSFGRRWTTKRPRMTNESIFSSFSMTSIPFVTAFQVFCWPWVELCPQVRLVFVGSFTRWAHWPTQAVTWRRASGFVDSSFYFLCKWLLSWCIRRRIPQPLSWRKIPQAL